MSIEVIRKMQKVINEKIEQRLIVINQKGRIRYFSWDEAFLSQKDVKRVFDETFTRHQEGSGVEEK